MFLQILIVWNNLSNNSENTLFTVAFVMDKLEFPSMNMLHGSRGFRCSVYLKGADRKVSVCERRLACCC